MSTLVQTNLAYRAAIHELARKIIEIEREKQGMNDGMIELDTEFAQSIGFTKDKFRGYLWKEGNVITISLIESRVQGQGYLRELFNNIEAKGFKIQVPTPLGKMQAILEHYGFSPHSEPFAPEIGNYDLIEVWEKITEDHSEITIAEQGEPA
jgi:hypothetical protein